MNNGMKNHMTDTNRDDGVYLYCPKEIIDMIDFSDEVRFINKNRGLSRKIDTEGLKTNFILMLNWLSNNIFLYAGDSETFYLDAGKLRNICSDKYYRICIEILKKYKLLYIKTVNGKETYKVRSHPKSYRWNKSKYQMENMKEVYTHRVTHHLFVKKVVNDIDNYQCFFSLKKHMVKQDRTISKFKKPKGFGKNRGMTMMGHDIKYAYGKFKAAVYVSSKKLLGYINRKKYGMQRLLCQRFNCVIKKNIYFKLSLSDMKRIFHRFTEYFLDKNRENGCYPKDFVNYYDYHDPIIKLFRYCDTPDRLF
jgi:hypothetical protein